MIKNLNEIIEGANVEGLISLEQISKGQNCKPLLKGPDSTNPKPFAWNFFTISDYLVEAAKFFEGEIVVDLGAGQNIDGYVLSKICGAKSYVAVDHRYTQVLFKKMNMPDKAIGDIEFKKMLRREYKFLGTIPEYDKNIVERVKTAIDNHLMGNSNDVPLAFAAEDMLTFLKRIPANSVCVLACGIDKIIISDNKYANQIEKEISRVLSDKGAYLGLCSRFNPKSLIKDKIVSNKTFVKYTKNKI